MDLAKLNSATKYPSILTYHEIGDRGRLTERLTATFFAGEQLYATEKIDGTNARIIFLDGDYFIGSREHLLYAMGDRIGDPAQGIVSVLKSLADSLVSHVKDVVVFGEVYGGKASSASKQYTSDGASGFRIFDLMKMHDVMPKLSLDAREIAAWRDAGGQQFVSVDDIDTFAGNVGLGTVPLLLGTDSLPQEMSATYEWLKAVLPTSASRLDDAAPGKPEGVVVRNGDRSKIVKIRFEDYQRTLR